MIFLIIIVKSNVDILGSIRGRTDLGIFCAEDPKLRDGVGEGSTGHLSAPGELDLCDQGQRRVGNLASRSRKERTDQDEGNGKGNQ